MAKGLGVIMDKSKGSDWGSYCRLELLTDESV